jgi:hypothetical protein
MKSNRAFLRWVETRRTMYHSSKLEARSVLTQSASDGGHAAQEGPFAAVQIYLSCIAPPTRAVEN